MDGLLPLFAALTPESLVFIALGTILGVVVGAIPGLTGGMLIALSIPLTFGMGPVNALSLLVAMYMGSVSGGLVAAILLRIPGTPASVMTTLDGYPLAMKGQAGRALGVAAASSLVGGVVSWFILVLLAYPLSVIAIRFTPWDYFALTLMALGLITSVSGGSQLKSLLSAVAGLLLAMPGDDPSVGVPRLTFGLYDLENGFSELPVFLGLFAISQVLKETERGQGGANNATRSPDARRLAAPAGLSPSRWQYDPFLIAGRLHRPAARCWSQYRFAGFLCGGSAFLARAVRIRSGLGRRDRRLGGCQQRNGGRCVDSAGGDGNSGQRHRRYSYRSADLARRDPGTDAVFQ